MSSFMWKVVSDGDKYNVKTPEGLKFKEPISKDKAENIVDAWENKYRNKDFKIVHIDDTLYNVQSGKKMILSKPQDLKTVNIVMKNIGKIQEQIEKLDKKRFDEFDKELAKKEEELEKYYKKKIKKSSEGLEGLEDMGTFGERKKVVIQTTVEEAIRIKEARDLAELLEYKRMK